MFKIDFDAAEHSYKINGSSVVNVTRVISEIIGGWQYANGWHLQRGRAIHESVSWFFQGKKFKFDPRIAGYMKAVESFRDAHKIEGGETEVRAGSLIYSFAGTIDFVTTIKRAVTIIDWKHSLDHRLVRVRAQLGGYSQAYLEMYGKEINQGFGVELHKDGTYKMTDPLNLRTARYDFLALRSAYRQKEMAGTLTENKS